MSKFVFLQRISDGAILDIPEDQVEETLKRGGFKPYKQTGEVYADSTIELPKPDAAFECPLCGKVCKTALTLGKHKKTHYDDKNK